MDFILRGVKYSLTRDEVRTRMEGIKPKPIRKYYVVVNRRRYPIKQVIATCLDLYYVEFGTADAAQILRRLGFKLLWF